MISVIITQLKSSSVYSSKNNDLHCVLLLILEDFLNNEQETNINICFENLCLNLVKDGSHIKVLYRDNDINNEIFINIKSTVKEIIAKIQEQIKDKEFLKLHQSWEKVEDL